MLKETYTCKDKWIFCCHSRDLWKDKFFTTKLLGYHYLKKITPGSRKMKSKIDIKKIVLRIHRSIFLEYCFWRGYIHHCPKVLVYKIALCEGFFLTLKPLSGLSGKSCFLWKLHGCTGSPSLVLCHDILRWDVGRFLRAGFVSCSALCDDMFFHAVLPSSHAMFHASTENMPHLLNAMMLFPCMLFMSTSFNLHVWNVWRHEYFWWKWQ